MLQQGALRPPPHAQGSQKPAPGWCSAQNRQRCSLRPPLPLIRPRRLTLPLPRPSLSSPDTLSRRRPTAPGQRAVAPLMQACPWPCTPRYLVSEAGRHDARCPEFSAASWDSPCPGGAAEDRWRCLASKLKTCRCKAVLGPSIRSQQPWDRSSLLQAWEFPVCTGPHLDGGDRSTCSCLSSRPLVPGRFTLCFDAAHGLVWQHSVSCSEDD